MSKFALVHTIRRELLKVNQQIDLKIVQGRAYHREARQHRTLLNQLGRLNGLSNRSLGIFSFF